MDATIASAPEASAAHEMAVRLAEGLGLPQDWAAALDYLQRSAELGSRLAQAELAALSCKWTLAHEILAGQAALSLSWSELRDTIDLARWLEVPQKAVVSESPRIGGVKNFASPEACDWIIGRARSRLRPAQIYDDQSGHHRISSTRTNSVAPFRSCERDFIFSILRTRIAELTQLPVQEMENPHVLHYSVGQEFQPHYDTPENTTTKNFRKRVLTFLIALNDDYDGGETAFFAVKGRWKGRKGGALFFSNVGPDGMLDRRTLHAGLPVTRGEKWILSQWIEG